MTTRRNNMFYYRGACSAYSTILQIMEEIKSDEERITMFERFHKSWLDGARAIATNKEEPEIDSCTIFTEQFYVTIEDSKYVVLDDKINDDSFNRMILWNEHTKTNYIIDFTGDWESVIDFIESDENFTDNMAKLIGCDTNELEEIDRPMVIYVIPEHGDSLFY